jgi:threonine/homoserine/homoserine lactone efflux protein
MAAVLTYILVGGGFAFAAAFQPGPLQAFLLSRVASAGWRRTLPAALAPAISDVPIALLVLTVLHQVAGGLERFLRGAGGIVLLYFAVTTFLEWRRWATGAAIADQSPPRTLLQAVAVNIINPNPYIGWSLVLGPLALEAWAQSPANAIALVGSFYLVIVLSLAVFILLVGATSFLGPRGRRALLLASSIVLAGIGVYSLVSLLSRTGRQVS